jgi:hypothetical protein
VAFAIAARLASPAVNLISEWADQRTDGANSQNGCCRAVRTTLYLCPRGLPRNREEGQKPLDVALKYFEKPLRFRGLLAQAEEDDVASRLDDADLAQAARQIRELDAAAERTPAA